MKEITLTQGKIALVDDEDFKYLNQLKWHTVKVGKRHYAANSKRINNIITRTFMHRLIKNTSQLLQVDHIDHNGLNNQKSNLRNCTFQQNQMNKQTKNATGYKGVYKHKNLYISQITPPNNNRRSIHLGYFKTKELAALAYNKAAIKYHGEFANLNYIKLCQK
jgi:hypothetical protein